MIEIYAKSIDNRQRFDVYLNIDNEGIQAVGLYLTVSEMIDKAILLQKAIPFAKLRIEINEYIKRIS